MKGIAMPGVGIAMSRAGQRAGAAPTNGRGFDVVRIALAAILLTAAALKGHQLATEPVAGKDIFSYRWPLMAQVEFEIVLGAWLLSGLFRRLAWAATLACFVFFCGVTLYKALSGAASCGCFGRVQVSPWYTLILDVWGVAALLVFPPKAAPAAPRRNSRRRLLAAGLPTLLVGVPAGVAMGSYQPAQLADDGGMTTAGRFVLLEPERWAGKRFPLLGHVDIGDRLSKGDWIVLFKHDGCPGCAEAVPRYQRLAATLARENSPVSMAMIDLEPTKAERLAAERSAATRLAAAQTDAARTAGDRATAGGLAGSSSFRPWVDGLLPAEKEWFVTTPAVVVLKDGQVRGGWEGKAPTPEQLLKELGGRARQVGQLFKRSGPAVAMNEG